ncbi:MAG: hypothetical protein MUC88_15020 [Planctomycetes bacterium]|jgi:hypothetical protein|nr:hypothetical protein [Planctomycetota bacterium]
MRYTDWNVALLLVGVLIPRMGTLHAAESVQRRQVPVVDGVVQPCRAVRQALADAMQFLKRADGAYVPGRIDGELAGYFTRAHVNEDGSRADRQLAFPARQHAYFIFTFLRYHASGSEREWLLRARDLADWNLAHSTPAEAVYAGLPCSVFSNGKPGGSGDKDSIEPDKGAFLGSAYLALYEATGEKKYWAGARAIAQTLARCQNPDGSWPFRVVPHSGQVRQEFGGAPVFFVQFFEDVLRHEKESSFQQAHDRALRSMLDRNVERNLWGTYHEDIGPKPEDYLSAEPMSFTAVYLFRHAAAHPEYLDMGRRVLARMEERLVHTEGHPAAPAPAVSEQAGFEHMMPGHTARYCLALAALYAISGDEQVKKKALSGIHALTYMQSEAGLFRTFFQLRHEKKPGARRPDWYSQHLYTVCHVLEALPVLSTPRPSALRTGISPGPGPRDPLK